MNLTQRVSFAGGVLSNAFSAKDRTGKIVGMGHIVRDNKTQPVYLVELDEGFWSEDKSTWVSIIAVDRSILLPIV